MLWISGPLVRGDKTKVSNNGGRQCGLSSAHVAARVQKKAGVVEKRHLLCPSVRYSVTQKRPKKKLALLFVLAWGCICRQRSWAGHATRPRYQIHLQKVCCVSQRRIEYIWKTGLEYSTLEFSLIPIPSNRYTSILRPPQKNSIKILLNQNLNRGQLWN